MTERGRQEVGRMKAQVELLFAEENRVEATFEIPDGLMGTRLYSAIDKAIRKGDYGHWRLVRWNLLDIIEKGEPGYEQ